MEPEPKFQYEDLFTEETLKRILPQFPLEQEVLKKYGNINGPLIHLCVELDLCKIFEIKLADLGDNNKIKIAFRAKSNKIKEDSKDAIYLNLAFHLYKIPFFKYKIDLKTGIFKTVIASNIDILVLQILFICREFKLMANLNQSFREGPHSTPLLVSLKDHSERDFLYLASMYNYSRMVRKMLAWPIDINSTQITGSTSLHASSYYGHLEIVEILMKCGASLKIKNKFGNTAVEEVMNDKIIEIIQFYSTDILYNFVVDLRSYFPCGCQEIFNEEGEEIAFYVKNPFPNPYQHLNLYYNNETFHGTKLKNVLSIMKNGFIVPGESTKDGLKIEICKGHINNHISIDGIKNFAQAIFISKSPFYASHPTYAEVISSRKKQYIVVLKLAVVDCGYSKHKATTYPAYQLKDQEDPNVEFRVPYAKFISIEGVYFLEEKHFHEMKQFGEFWHKYGLKFSPFPDKNGNFEEILMGFYPLIKHIGNNEKKENLIKINLKYQIHNEIYEIWVKADIQTEDFENEVIRFLWLPENVFALFFEGHCLTAQKNIGKRLLQFKIKHESCVYLIFRNRGG